MLPQLPKLLNFRIPEFSLTRHQKLAALSVTLGFAFFSFLAALIRRRRRNRGEKKQYSDSHDKRPSRQHLGLNQYGEFILRNRRSASPSTPHPMLKNKSLSNSMTSIGEMSTSSTLAHSNIDIESLSPLQLCELGLQNLQVAITHWEDAIMKLSYLDDQPNLAIPDAATAALQHRLETLLDRAYRTQDAYERECEHHSDLIAFDSAISAFTEMDRLHDRPGSLDNDSMSDQDSFASATDMANLSDLETHRELFHHLALYEAGLLELKFGNIHCRTLRTVMTNCLSDTEFLAKLHCVRLALQAIFREKSNREYFSILGKQIIGNLLLQAERDPEDFYTAYQGMVDYVDAEENWSSIEEELRGRGVKVFTFYDIFLDFIMMDAFDDLDNPPSSVTAVVQNRWLSNGLKETAISTAVWSVLKAKRRMLKVPNGFLKNFYAISEHTTPVLAWGFLGPESEVKTLCIYFKDLVLTFIKDIFSFEKVRFTTVDDLAADILGIAQVRTEEALRKLTLG